MVILLQDVEKSILREGIFEDQIPYQSLKNQLQGDKNRHARIEAWISILLSEGLLSLLKS